MIPLWVAPALLPQAADQPKIEARKAPVITWDRLKFRDLNKNGTLDPYEDWRLPVGHRVADLVSRMTLEGKTGLMIHSSLSGFTGPNGEVLRLPAAGGRGGPGRGGPSASNQSRVPGPSQVEQRRAYGQRQSGPTGGRAERPLHFSPAQCRRWNRISGTGWVEHP